MAKNMIRLPFPRGGIRTRLPVTIYRRSSDEFSPTEISGLALWLDASSTDSLYTTDAGPVVAVASPLDIAGCQLWLDASEAASITASSGEVTAWADKSATGSSWTRVGDANGPATGTQTMGGKNVLVFDGTNDGLSAVTPLNTSMPLTFFVVQRVVSGTVAGMTYTAGTSDAFNWRQAADTLGTLEVTAGGSRMQLGGALLSQNTLYSLTVPASSNASIYRDGTVVSITTNAALKPTLTGTHYLGRRSDGFYGNVHIAEIVAYSAELTTAQRASVEAYLAAKWSISGVHAPATASSDPVGYWGDKSGNGRHLTQPTSTARPTRVSSHVNGRTALTFDGTDFLSVANSVALGNNTVIMVVREDATSNYAGLVSYYPATGSDNGNADGWVADLQVGDNVIQLSSGIFAAQWVGAFSLPLSVLTLRRQTDAGNRQIIRANGVTNAVNANASTGTAAGILIGGRFQSGAVDTLYRAKITVCEVLRWDRALTPAEYTRAETALARKWGITLAPQVANADAQNWIDRVYSNGGTVSSATAAAVNSLCDSLESASLRDRFYRLNLFCGSNLNAALVPLYRGPSLGGTQYGGTTDTNVGGLFVSGNYSESGGLVGDGSTKYLKTGLASNQLAGGLTGHAAIWRGAGTVATTRIAIGGSDNDVDDFEIQERSASTHGAWGKTTFAGSTPANVAGLKMINRSSSTRVDLYSNGSSIANSTASVVVAPHANEFYVFGGNRNGTLTLPVALPVFAYSLGVSMDATQATAYYNALSAFQTSLSRT